MKVTVLVRPKDGILDPQGEAIRQALSTLGYPASSVRAGRLFDVELDVSDPAEAERIGREAADRVLANGLIEGYEVVIEGVAAEAAEVAAEHTRSPRTPRKSPPNEAAHRRDHVPRDLRRPRRAARHRADREASRSRSGTPTIPSTGARA